MRRRYFPEKQRKNAGRKKFPKTLPQMEHVRPSEAAFLASLVTTGAFLKPSNSKAGKKEAGIIVRSQEKECALGKGEFVLLEYKELHLGDEFPCSDVPLRLEEHNFIKLERIDSKDQRPMLKESLISKMQFENLKSDAKEVFTGQVDVVGAEVVKQEREAIAAVACPVKENKVDGKTIAFISGLTSGAVIVIMAITAWAFIFRRMDSVESENHSKKEEQEHSKDNGR